MSSKPKATSKDRDLAQATSKDDKPLTTNLGHPISTDKHSLRAGTRGPLLLEDFVLREKLQHFDHERIPERIVHARGAAAHGYFELHTSLEPYTTAKVLTEVGKQVPVFVRFSTVAGSRGSADTPRDVRGFAVKLYTDEGNWDIVGNNMPVFFIQDAIKFPDLIHAVKPEPHHEMPQAASAHDTFWDFISFTPEAMHMIMWVMSDRAIPLSYATMEGFGVHSFRLINADGHATFVKFHWKPVLGAHSLVWDEAVKIAGADADFNRRQMWEGIEAGIYPEWEFGVQLLDEADELKYDFDPLDPTKLWPEELIPVQRVGKMVLNRNPDNFFAETEQVAFNTTNIVPGIEFSNDPLLQGRNFSYLDTQLSRLGSPNFTELPINRPVAEVSNNQRDAHMRFRINKGRVSYTPASLDGHSPDEEEPGHGFRSYAEHIEGTKVRQRSPSFEDFYGQARLFWNSMTPVERAHIVRAIQFELSKVETPHVRVNMLDHLREINEVLARQVAKAIGEASFTAPTPGGTADEPDEIAALAEATSPTSASGGLEASPALSQMQGQPSSARARKVAVLVAKGSDAAQIGAVKAALEEAGARCEIVGPHLGTVSQGVEAVKTYANTASVLYDGVYVPGGASAVKALLAMGDARRFVAEAFKHGKPIAASAEGTQLVQAADLGGAGDDPDHLARMGLFLGEDAASVGNSLVKGLAKHRFTDRPQVPHVAA